MAATSARAPRAATRPARRTAASAAPAPAACNEVRLVGRVSSVPEQRELPSADLLVTWRLVVDRPASRHRGPVGGRQTVLDTLDCVAWAASARRHALRLQPGDVVEVTGAVRRRFWRSGSGPSNKTEIEADAVRRLARG